MSKFLSILILICASIFVLANQTEARTPNHILGKILLQVEDNGEAWYVNPDSGQRFYLKDGRQAYSILEWQSLGITNDDLSKIPVGLNSFVIGPDSDADGLSDHMEQALGTNPKKQDSDGDDFSDYEEIQNDYSPLGPGHMEYDQDLVNRLSGKLLIQTQSLGQAWYLNPDDGKRYYMKNGDAAYQIMRQFGLGITNQDLTMIEIGDEVIECGDDLSCVYQAIYDKKQVEFTFSAIHKEDDSDGNYVYDVTVTGDVIVYPADPDGTMRIVHTTTDRAFTGSEDTVRKVYFENFSYSDDIMDGAIESLKEKEKMQIGTVTECNVSSQGLLLALITNWQNGALDPQAYYSYDCKYTEPI